MKKYAQLVRNKLQKAPKKLLCFSGRGCSGCDDTGDRQSDCGQCR